MSETPLCLKLAQQIHTLRTKEQRLRGHNNMRQTGQMRLVKPLEDGEFPLPSSKCPLSKAGHLLLSIFLKCSEELIVCIPECCLAGVFIYTTAHLYTF